MGSESIETAIASKPLSPSRKFFLPGFRFHPTDEELVLYYLKRKICGRSLKLNIIGEVDVYKWDPEELPGKSKWKTGDRQWFFFSPRDRKYANGGRSSRATLHGYWKATGKDRIIKCNSRAVGVKKTLVYYQGRAPSGERTDWVMHEYTLYEEELGRCRYVQEYYALCKVFKKSGLGPKNGEQYGAPFVEEEWSDDDDYLDVDALLVQKISSEINEPEIVPPLPQINLVNGEEESQDSLLVRSLTKVDFLDQTIAMGPSHELLDVQPGSDLAQSANEPSVEELQPSVVNEDFLEMDDLIDPQSASQNTELLVLEDLQFADFDGFNEFDLYNDLTRLNEMNPFETQDIQQPYYTHNLEYRIQDSGFHSYSNCAGSEDVNAELQTGYLWMHDQSPCDFTAAQLTDDFTAVRATDAAMSAPSSGVITDENPGNPDSGVIQCRRTREDDGTDSWFSSALWDFVESVPTTLASALESNALVNKACERMSGLSRVRNANKATVGGGVKCSLARRRFEPSSRSSSETQKPFVSTPASGWWWKSTNDQKVVGALHVPVRDRQYPGLGPSKTRAGL